MQITKVISFSILISPSFLFLGMLSLILHNIPLHNLVPQFPLITQMLEPTLPSPYVLPEPVVASLSSDHSLPYSDAQMESEGSREQSISSSDGGDED